MKEPTLNEFISDLIGTNQTPGLLNSDYFHGRSFDRGDKLRLFLPDDFLNLIHSHKGSYKSYYTWLLNGDSRANNLRKQAANLFDTNSLRYLKETEELCHKLLFTLSADDLQTASFSSSELFHYLTGHFSNVCFHFSDDTNSIIRAHLRYLSAVSLEKAITGCFYFLLFKTSESSLKRGKTGYELLIQHGRLDSIFYVSQIKSQNNENMTDIVSADERTHFRESCEYALLQYNLHNYAEAWESHRKLQADEKLQLFPEYANGIFYRLGVMYQKGIGGPENPTMSRRYFEQAVAYGTEGFYELHICYLHGNGCRKNLKKAKAYLEKAVNTNDYRGIRDLAVSYYHGNAELEVELDRYRAKDLLQRGVLVSETPYQDGTCHYFLSQFMLNEGNLETAAFYLEKAIMYGHADAEILYFQYFPNRPLSTDIKHNSTSQPSLSENESDSSVIFCNEENFFTRQIFTTPGNCYSSLAHTIIEKIKEKINEQSIKNLITNHECYEIFLFSDQESKNLTDVFHIFSYIKNLLYKCPDPDLLIHKITIYIRSCNPETALLLDQVEKSLEPFYLKIRICNPYQDAAQSLLFSAPLFLAETSAESVDHTVPHTVTICGHGDAAFYMIKNILGSTVPYVSDSKKICTRNMNIIVADHRSGEIKQRLERECPGVLLHQNLTNKCIYFFSHSPLDMEYSKSQNISMFEKCNYYIFASDEGTDNLHSAVLLREKLLRSDSLFEDHSIIAAYCPYLLLAESSSDIICYTDFNIYSYGSIFQLYTPSRLRNNIIDQLTHSVRFSYLISNDQRVTERKKHFSFYTNSNNRESAKASRISLIYHMANLGIQLTNWQDYGTAYGCNLLGEKYKEKKTQNAEKTLPEFEFVSESEHIRWNGFMMAEGWLPASIQQMRTYMEKGSSKHYLPAARLHPYIASWKDLGDFKHGIQYEINQLLLLRNPNTKFTEIKEYDRNMILNMDLPYCTNFKTGE